MDVELTTGQSVIGAFLIALALAALHLAAPRIRKLPLVPERATGYFAGQAPARPLPGTAEAPVPAASKGDNQ